MDEAHVERRLAAILVAAIAGYSRLMAEDEAATVAALKGHQAVVLPMVAAHGGRIQDTAGDGILAEFRATATVAPYTPLCYRDSETIDRHQSDWR